MTTYQKASSFHEATYFQPVVKVNEPAALQVELVGDADVGSRVGHGSILSLQAFILEGKNKKINTKGL